MLKCSLCGDTLHSQGFFVRHMASNHYNQMLNDVVTYFKDACPLCHKETIAKSAHMKNHNPLDVCFLALELATAGIPKPLADRVVKTSNLDEFFW